MLMNRVFCFHENYTLISLCVMLHIFLTFFRNKFEIINLKKNENDRTTYIFENNSIYKLTDKNLVIDL